MAVKFPFHNPLTPSSFTIWRIAWLKELPELANNRLRVEFWLAAKIGATWNRTVILDSGASDQIWLVVEHQLMLDRLDYGK